MQGIAQNHHVARQLNLCGLFQHRRLNVLIQRFVRFRQDVGDALVGCRQRRRFLQRTEVGNRLHTRVEIGRFGRTARQHRLNGIYAVAFVLIPGAEAAQHKVDHIVDHFAVRQLIAVETHRLFGQGLQIQRQVLLNDNTQHAQRGTAQRKRVFIAFRMLADTEDPREGIHLIGNRHGASHRVRRQLVTGKARLILLVQRDGNVFRFAVVTRIVHAHHALGIGKLEHHVGHQVALGEQARARGVVHICANLTGNPARQRLNTIGLVAQRAELLLEQHGLQTRQVIFQAFFTVGIEEELGIRQTRAHHFFITGDNLLRIFRLDIGDEDEIWQQFAVVAIHREVLLVTLHGVDQRFRRNGEEFLFELRRQHHRPLNQRGDLFQQAVAQIGSTANLTRRLFGVRFDFGFTFGVIRHHFAALQQDLRVLIGVVDGELRLAHKAVAANDAIGLNTKDRCRNQLVAQQQGNGVNRTHKVHVRRAPAHQFRDWQFAKRGGDHVRQQRFAAFAFHMGAIEQPFAFVGGQTLGLIDGDTAAARPAFSRFARFAFRVERLGDGRAAFFNFAIRLRSGKIRHFQRQTARRGEPLNLAVGNACRIQFSGKVGSEGLSQAAQGFWWQLFGADFHQECFL